MPVVFLLTAILATALVAESVYMRRRVRSIPVRVHVGGTRGKSSVTRCIVAALRLDGRAVMGKITGVVPTILEPDGSTRVIRRPGPARVQEQVRMIFRAGRLRCDALVLECMSIAPALQGLETRLLRPTLTVLTNVGDDHREEYGSSPEELAEGPLACIPRGGLLVSGENSLEHFVRLRAGHLGTQVVRPGPEDLELAAQMPAGAARENAALVLSACRMLGVSRAAALAAIAEDAALQEGELIVVAAPEGSFRFLNGFAVNDVPSAQKFLDGWAARLGGWTSLTILLNTRADRPLRSIRFARWCATLADLQQVIVLGSHVPRTRRALLDAGIPRQKVSVWTSLEKRDPRAHLIALRIDPRAVVAGFGNIAGDGGRVLERLRT
jgi:poly-gamma-glutamate synthase PgsB/CapB